MVQVGHAGLTDAVYAQLGGALDTHELIKVKLAKEAPIDTAAAAEAIATHLKAEVAQRIGRVLVVFRARAEGATLQLPRG